MTSETLYKVVDYNNWTSLPDIFTSKRVAINACNETKAHGSWAVEACFKNGVCKIIYYKH